MTTDFDLTRYKALSFDCYGTLIDWEAGIAAVLSPWARPRSTPLTWRLSRSAPAVRGAASRDEASVRAVWGIGGVLQGLAEEAPYRRLLGGAFVAVKPGVENSHDSRR
jgi:hypothetical protein